MFFLVFLSPLLLSSQLSLLLLGVLTLSVSLLLALNISLRQLVSHCVLKTLGPSLAQTEKNQNLAVAHAVEVFTALIKLHHLLVCVVV